MNSKRFGSTLSNSQIQLARRIEAAGLTTYSQAVKAMERNETRRLEEWKRQLDEKEAQSE